MEKEAPCLSMWGLSLEGQESAKWRRRQEDTKRSTPHQAETGVRQSPRDSGERAQQTGQRCRRKGLGLEGVMSATGQDQAE